MSEEEIINTVIAIKNHQIAVFEPKENIQITRNYFTEEQRNALQCLLDLYNKEKEKNKKSISIEKIEKVLENSVCSYDCLKENIQSLLYGEDCHR